ncbi:hypothetical protein JCGZ_06666 [Jatropha curcas]|uniref:Uncharacterized protein n=1 Tax=Jatropha curcas TaxID=180498 RepID=A0A067LMV3_JATCU|nr:hypothetical protein JCGZ_06666 [Jatropha curcas]
MDPQKVENAPNILKHRDRDSLQSEPFDLRKSLAWDSAFFTSPGVLDAEELFETLNFQIVDNGADIAEQKEPKSSLSKSTTTARTSGIDNLRKSLAWDSAFFTNAGVLDAEELSVLNRGFKKPEMLHFPGFDEEIWRSAESNSTITSDGHSLASLEIDLFDDIRASINKSIDASFNYATSACKLKGEKPLQTGHASKISDASSRATHTASNGKSKSLSSVKPPKISGRANPSPIVPSKRASLGANVNQAIKSASGKDMAMPKKMCLRELSSSKPTSTSPSSVLPAGVDQFAGFGYTSADFTSKSSSNLLRRTTGNFRLTASGSSLRTPLKCSVGNKNELVNSSDSICLLSTPKSSAYASPASSIDGWYSNLPSSTSIKQRSNSSSRERSLDIGASKASNSEVCHYNQLFLGHEIQETKFMNPQINNNTICNSPANISRKLRPSGLRTPSPKIGFFDSESSAGIAENAGLKFHSGTLGSSKPRNGISNANGSNRTRNGKHRLAGSSTGMKEEGKFSLREKKQPLKERGDVKGSHYPENMHGIGEYNNKENIGRLANQVDDLSRRIGAIDFWHFSGE